MAEMTTQQYDGDVAKFLARVADQKRKVDAEALCALMTEVTGVAPAMWGTSIVGFGSYRYRYSSGREGQAPAVGMSPRKQNLTIYVYAGLDGHADLLNLLGPHSLGKGCLYLRRLYDVDEGVLRQIVGASFTQLNGRTITPDIG